MVQKEFLEPHPHLRVLIYKSTNIGTIREHEVISVDSSFVEYKPEVIQRPSVCVLISVFGKN